MYNADQGVVISAQGGSDYIQGGGLGDELYGEGGDDYIYAGSGADTISGGDGDDVLYGGTDAGPGNLDADTDRDLLYGGEGSDTVHVDSHGADIAYGGLGNDVYWFRPGGLLHPDNRSEIIENDGEGRDTIIALATNFSGSPLVPSGYGLQLNVENLVLGADILGGYGNELDNSLLGNARNNFMTGWGGDDLIAGEGGNDELFGGEGHDALLGDDGTDTMTGGLGDDVYGVDRASDRVVEGANEGYDEVHSSGDFTLPDNVETLFLIGSATYGIGNGQSNAIIGNDANNILDVGAGASEFMNGAGGNDLLIGGAGHDEIMGGTGADRFRFQDPADAGDFVYDFTPGTDQIQLNASAFGLKTLQAGVTFIVGTDVRAAAPTLLYNQPAGYLIFDPDGTGAASPVLLAILNGTPTLTTSDFSFY
jgi:Ca2+-binding RTX toxin-like protein